MEPDFFRFTKTPGNYEQRPGERTDIKHALTSCTNIIELLERFPDVACKGYSTFCKFYDALNMHTDTRRKIPCTTVWIYGESGTGKSYSCQELGILLSGAQGSVYRHNSGDYSWWDGYVNQQIIIMEELRRNKITKAGGLAQFLVYLDEYPIKLPTKGGFATRYYETVLINTAINPVAFFTYRTADGDVVDESVAQLIRRLHKIIELKTVRESTPGGDIVNVVRAFDHTARYKREYCSHLDNIIYLDPKELLQLTGL